MERRTGGRPRRTGQGGHPVKALGVTGDQDQQGPGQLRQNPAMHLQQGLLLAFMGAGRDPDRSIGSPKMAHEFGAILQTRGLTQVKLDAARDLHPCRRHAQVDEALGVGAGLGRDQGEAGEGLTGEATQAPIAPGGTGGEAAIAQDHRDTAPLADPQHVGPDFGLHDQYLAGPDAIQEAIEDGGQVIGDIDMTDPILEEGAQPLGPRRRGGGDHDSQIGVLIEEILDEGRSGLGLPHRYGMNPEPGRQGLVAIEAEPLPPALAIGRGPPAPPQEPQQGEGQSQV